MPRRNPSRRNRLIVTSFLLVPLLIGNAVPQVRSQKPTSQKSMPCFKRNGASRARHGRPVLLASSELMDRVIQKRPIERPGPLGKNSLRGVVSIEVLINKQGKVICARGVDGHPLAIVAAIRSLRQWTFRPYAIGHKPTSVAGVLSVPFDFGS